ncbi:MULTISPECIES: aminotransferase class I/II-fold pyridoxal phosphate-dependent enzyme [Helcococcus]|uniref:Aminotransferase n=1 Tax=Helcococcus bovis TaxID=3153252 RepID=A0ABW9F7C5_9FIRM
MKFNKIVEKLSESNILKFNHEINQIPEIVKLTLGEPDFNTPDHIKKAAKQAIDDNFTHYTASNGILDLREEVANYYNEKFNFNYTKDQVIVTVGATEGMNSTFQAILNPDDVVIIPTPTFPLYMPEIMMTYGKFQLVDTSDNGFVFTAEKLEEIIKNNPETEYKAVVLVNPNNPTGVSYTREQLEELAKVIKKYDLYVICDEIYAELVYEKSHYSMANIIPENTILITGLSKSHAMTGWRIGFILSSDEIVKEISKPHQFNVTNATSISQYGALAAVKYGKQDSELMKFEYKKRRDFLVDELTKLNFEVSSPDGAFYIFAKIPQDRNQNSQEFASEIAYNAKVATIPGSYFGPGGEGHLRISYATSMENLEKAVENLKEYLR